MRCGLPNNEMKLRRQTQAEPMRHPERRGGNEDAQAPPISGAGLGQVVRGAFVTQVDLDYERQCLSLRLMLRHPKGEAGRVRDPARASRPCQDPHRRAAGS
jgi:hypothetical protein